MPKELINAQKWQDVFTNEERDKFVELTKNLIGSATDRDNNYSDIMLALYNIISEAAYDYEIDTVL